MNHHVPAPAQIALSLLNEPKVRQLAAQGHVTPQVAEAFEEYSAAIIAHKRASDEYVAIHDELQSRANQMPSEGLREFQQRARQNFESASRELTRRSRMAFAKYQAALTAQAVPRINPAREDAGRRELDVVLGSGNVEAAVARLAASGSAEAFAVLVNSSYGKTVLESKGADADSLIAEAKTTRASGAAENGSTPREIVAGKLLKTAGRLAGAQGSIASSARSVLNGEARPSTATASSRTRTPKRNARRTRGNAKSSPRATRRHERPKARSSDGENDLRPNRSRQREPLSRPRQRRAQPGLRAVASAANRRGLRQVRRRASRPQLHRVQRTPPPDQAERRGVNHERPRCDVCGVQNRNVRRRDQLRVRENTASWIAWLCMPCASRHGHEHSQAELEQARGHTDNETPHPGRPTDRRRSISYWTDGASGQAHCGTDDLRSR